MAKNAKRKAAALIEAALRRGWQPGAGHVSDFAKKRDPQKRRPA